MTSNLNNEICQQNLLDLFNFYSCHSLITHSKITFSHSYLSYSCVSCDDSAPRSLNSIRICIEIIISQRAMFKSEKDVF